MIEVLKRDKKTKECFQEHKIRHAIESAYLSVGKNIDEEEDEALDFIAQQEDIAMQRARENAVDSVRKSRRNRN